MHTVSKSIDNTMRNIEDDMRSVKILITEPSKDLSKIIPKKKNNKYSINKLILSSQRLHIINALKERQYDLKKKVSTLKENQKIKENDGYLNLDSIALNKHKSELKEIKDKEEKLISRIDEINNQIEGLIYEEQKVKYNENKRKILKECIDNI